MIMSGGGDLELGIVDGSEISGCGEFNSEIGTRSDTQNISIPVHTEPVKELEEGS